MTLVRFACTAGSASSRSICALMSSLVASLLVMAAVVNAASGSDPRNRKPSWLATSYGLSVVSG